MKSITILNMEEDQKVLEWKPKDGEIRRLVLGSTLDIDAAEATKDLPPAERVPGPEVVIPADQWPAMKKALGDHLAALQKARKIRVIE